MPTFLAFKKGEKIGELTGAVPAKLKVSCHSPNLFYVTVLMYRSFNYRL